MPLKRFIIIFFHAITLKLILISPEQNDCCLFLISVETVFQKIWFCGNLVLQNFQPKKFYNIDHRKDTGSKTRQKSKILIFLTFSGLLVNLHSEQQPENSGKDNPASGCGRINLKVTKISTDKRQIWLKV